MKDFKLSLVPRRTASLANCFWLVALASLLFCASNSHAQRTVFREDFEGVFPGSTWIVDDLNPGGDFDAFWDDVPRDFGGNVPHGGDWMGYCAGDGFDPFGPYYWSDMRAIMERTVDLTTATNAELSFWYLIPSIEEGFDYCQLVINGTTIRFGVADTFVWTQVRTNLSAFVGGLVTIRFEFVSDGSVEEEGCYLDDIELTASPGDGGGGDRPNLTPHQPSGWSDKIVVSRVTGTTTDDSNLQGGDTLYLDWAVINNGTVEVTSTFTVQLYVDDVLRTSWSGGNLAPNFSSVVRDYSLGTLPAGTHTLKIVADSGNTVNESNENDNEYVKTIVIGGQPEIRIAPLEVTFNVTNGAGGNGFAASAPVTEATEEEIAFNVSTEQKLQAAHEVAGLLDGGAADVEVIVNLSSPAGKPLRGEWDSKPRLQRWHQAVKARQDDVLTTLEADDFKVRHRYENLSAFSGRVTRKGLEKLARHPRVASIELARQRQAHLAQGIPLMNAAIYRSSYDGTGTSVAIIDSGVDYNHPRLGGGGFPNTKVIGGRDFGDNDNNPIPDGNAHGTACAGIAAGALGTSGDYIGGVAPNAKIYALKITSGGSGSASDADIIAAWDWCISHKNDDPANPILVISTSFGGDRYTSDCNVSQSAYFTAANNAVAAGITVLASSGNEGYCNALASPACISSVISVGAVYDSAYASTTTFCVESVSCVSKSQDFSCFSGWSHSEPVQADRVTGYSNTSGFLDLLAPSHRAYTTDIVGGGGYSGGDYNSGFGGTSAACPYAAGAVAALQSAARASQGRYLTPAEVRTLLTTTGDLVRDVKNTSITTPRVNLGRAIESLGQSKSFTIFNEGNATLNVTSIVADASAPWISLTPPAPFTVPPGGAQVVAVAVDPALAPVGQSTRRLLVVSDDADESPYPGGVSITVTNVDTRPQIHGVLSGSQFVISWPTNSAGYVLRSSDSITGTWGTVNTTPITIGALRYVTNNVTPQRRFYRLERP
jgi:subtilisin family serine protease